MSVGKTYLRYEETETFGLVASHECDLVVDGGGHHILTSGLQDVLCWNVKTGEIEHRYRCENAQGDSLTFLALNRLDLRYVAGGYKSGVIRLWEYQSRKFVVLLTGHRSAISCLQFSQDNARLASGSDDTSIIIWDVVAQTGLFRLKGHKQQITAVKFLGQNTLMSSSKDTLLKLWDLETQHCDHTFVGHRSSVWDLALNRDETRIVTISSDQSIRGLAKMSDKEYEEELEKVKSLGTKSAVTANGNDEVAHEIGSRWKMMPGSIGRQTAERAMSAAYSLDGRYLGIQTAGKTLELYVVRTPDEVERKIKRRLKRLRERKKAENNEAEDLSSSAPQLGDELELIGMLKADERMRSFSFGRVHENRFDVIVSYNNNTVDIFSVQLDETVSSESKKRKRSMQLKRSKVIELQGHRNDIRTLALSSDDTLLLTAANGAAKLWNVNSHTCIRTFSSGYSLCCAFVPGDTYGMIGTRSGHLLLVNLSSGKLVSEIQAHEGAIWSMDVRPDGKGFVTGSADKVVKFWEFELQDEDDKDLTIVHTRTLKMSEDVMCVRYSRHKSASKLMLAIALMDCTVKIFHEDSLKFALSLYGHKLPVLSMDISSDSTLIATASADKNVKVWGLDFGDCHKSFFAHDDSVMCVRFVPRTHFFFTAGKDHRIRYWDADRFEMIFSLDGHIGEVWNLAISHDGSFFVSCAHDKSLKLWKKTDEIVFLEEEREKELEKKFDEQLVKGPGDNAKVGTLAVDAMKEQQAQNGLAPESDVAALRTAGTVKAGERLMDALDLADEERDKLKRYEEDVEYELNKLSKKERKKYNNAENPILPKPSPNIMLLGRSPLEHVLHTLRTIKTNELDDALIVQPFSYATRLLQYLELAVAEPEQDANKTRPGKAAMDIELVAKVSIALLKAHFKQIVATESVKHILLRLRTSLRPELHHLQDVAGTNMAALNLIKTKVAEENTMIK